MPKFQQPDENVEAMTFIEDDGGYFPMIRVRKSRILQYVARAFDGRQRSPYCPDEAYGDLPAHGSVRIVGYLAASRWIGFGDLQRGQGVRSDYFSSFHKKPGRTPNTMKAATSPCCEMGSAHAVMLAVM